jgi:hypothetical protein
MPLTTFEVPWVDGRVRFSTPEGSKTNVTVECFHRRIAFFFNHDGGPNLRPGRYVRIRGIVRLDTSIKSDGTLADKNLGYLHDPLDGSPRSHWLFIPLLHVESRPMGPAEVTESLQESIRLMARHIEDWKRSCGASELDQTIDSLEVTLRAVKSFREESNRLAHEPVVRYLDISV